MSFLGGVGVSKLRNPGKLCRRTSVRTFGKQTNLEPTLLLLFSILLLPPSFLCSSPHPLPSHIRSWRRLGRGQGSRHASLAERRTPRVSPGRTTVDCVHGRGATLKILVSSSKQLGRVVANGYIQPRLAAFYSTLVAWRCWKRETELY